MGLFEVTVSYLLIAGSVLLASILVPVPFVRRMGEGGLRWLYKLHVSSPIPALPGSVSLPLAIGMIALIMTGFSFRTWMRRFLDPLLESNSVRGTGAIEASVLSNSMSQAGRFRGIDARFLLERNLYMQALTAVIYLSLHTIARLNSEIGRTPVSSPVARVPAEARPIGKGVRTSSGGPAARPASTGARTSAQARKEM
jgi:hypothetical protein